MCVKKNVLISIVFLFFFIHGSAAGQTDKVTCIGKVLDSQGKPVEGAKVAAYEMVFDGIAGNFALHKAGEVITEDSGTFTFTSEPKPERSTFSDSKIVAVKESMSLGWTVWSMREDVELNIQLGEPQILKGMVVNETGEPVVGVDVYANLMMNIKTDTGEEKKDWLPGVEPMMCLGTRTDNQGRFVFNNLPENAEVGLLIKAPGRALTYTTESESNMTSPIQTGQTDVKVTIAKEGRIKGKILAPDTDKGIAGLKFAIVYTASGLFYYRFVCATDEDGIFEIGGLQTGKYLIRGTGIPSMEVDSEAGQTTQVSITANRLYYGRLLYENGNPVLADSSTQSGARIRIGFGGVDQRSRLNIDGIDNDGYFSVYLSPEQLRNLQSRKSWFELTIPYDEKSMRHEIVYALDLLSTEKDKAGVARIPKPKGEPESLVGKPLPELTKFNLALSNTITQDKSILICFFDMNQRPSRRYVSQLNEQIEQLSDKSVAVIGIQTSKIEEGTLDEWMKSSSISFPIGLISTNTDEVKFNWGVKSLPWLILTDKGHTVIAEGFTLDELEDMITSVAGN